MFLPEDPTRAASAPDFQTVLSPSTLLHRLYNCSRHQPDRAGTIDTTEDKSTPPVKLEIVRPAFRRWIFVGMVNISDAALKWMATNILVKKWFDHSLSPVDPVWILGQHQSLSSSLFLASSSTSMSSLCLASSIPQYSRWKWKLFPQCFYESGKDPFLLSNTYRKNLILIKLYNMVDFATSCSFHRFAWHLQ